MQHKAVEDWSSAIGALGLGNEASPQAIHEDNGDDSLSMPSRGGTALTVLTGQFGDADVSAISEVLDHSLDDSLDIGSLPGVGVQASQSAAQKRITELRQEQQELRVKLVMTEAAEDRHALAERLKEVTFEIDSANKLKL